MVAPSVPDQRPYDVDASAGESEDGLDMPFPLGSFAVVEP